MSAAAHFFVLGDPADGRWHVVYRRSASDDADCMSVLSCPTREIALEEATLLNRDRSRRLARQRAKQ